MSAESLPITPAAFAEATKELALPSLHAKAAELRNSIYHLRRSNAQLQSFADEGDRDCADAVKENEEVMASMEERIELLRLEVEVNRGMRWVDNDKPVATEDDPANAPVGGERRSSSTDEHTTQSRSATGCLHQPTESIDQNGNAAQGEHEGVFL